MFKDDDIKLHLRKLGLSRGATVTRYEAIGIPSETPGVGKEPHMAKLRRENNRAFSLADAQPGMGWRKL